jgi:hypothetical protein
MRWCLPLFSFWPFDMRMYRNNIDGFNLMLDIFLSSLGGFYGSAGARVSSTQPVHHPEALVRQQDITALAQIMHEVETYESELRTLGV